MPINDQDQTFASTKTHSLLSKVNTNQSINAKPQQQTLTQNYMIRQAVKKSTYLQQEIADDQQQSQHLQNLRKTYKSKYALTQQQLTNKQEQKLIQSIENSNNKNIKDFNLLSTHKFDKQNIQDKQDNQEKQEYESISSDKSQQREKQIQQDDYNKTIKYTDLLKNTTTLINKKQSYMSAYSSNSNKNINNDNTRSIINKSDNITHNSKIGDKSDYKGKISDYRDKLAQYKSKVQMKSESKMLQQSIPIKYGQNHIYQASNAKQSLTSSNNSSHEHNNRNKIADTHNNRNKVTSITEGFQHLQSQNKQPINPKTSITSSNSSFTYLNKLNTNNNNQIQSSSKQTNTFQQLKYPSLLLEKQSSKILIKSQHTNYPLSTMKKTTSQYSASNKRSQSLQNNKQITHQHQQQTQSIKYYDDININKNPNLSNKHNNFQGTIQQQFTQPNMFYVSISGQQMYPSLDLKKINQKHHNIVNQKAYKKQINIKKSSFTLSQQSDPSLPYQIKILQYRSEYFLKVQTQVFTIQVIYPPQIVKDIELKPINNRKQSTNSPQQSLKKVCLIQRRFSDFVFLYQSIVTNHLGYIIYPFPQKSLQSFIKIKLQSLIGNTIISDPTSQYEAQKMQLIQHRIAQLQRFVNFLLQHQELKYSQQLAIFLTPDNDLYMKSRQRINKYIEQYRQLQSSGNIIEQSKKNIKKVISTGYGMVMKWWGSSQNTNTNIKTDNNIKSINNNTTITTDEQQLTQQFNQYSQLIQTCHFKFHMLQKSLKKLIQMYDKIIDFKDIDTDFDYLVGLCAKVSSGKEYVKSMKIIINQQLLKQVQLTRRWLQQTKQQLNKRQQLKLLIQQLKSSLGYNADLPAKISKLQRRLQRFNKNFRFGFNNLIKQCEQTFLTTKTVFTNQWQLHSKNMRKIWR